MHKVRSYPISPEMIFLWVLETAIYFLVLNGLLSSSLFFAAAIRLHVVDDAAILSLTMGLATVAGGLYQPRAFLALRSLPAKIVASAVMSILMIGVASQALHIDIAGVLERGVLWPIAIVLGWIGFVFATRALFSLAVRMNLFVRHVMIVGSPAEAARISAAMTSPQQGFLRVAATMSLADAASLSPTTLRQQGIRELVVSADAGGGPGGGLGAEQLAHLRQAGIRIWGGPEFWERRLGRIDIEQAALQMRPSPGDHTGRARLVAAIRRLLDMALSIGLLVGTLPLMALTALLIKLESPGPVFYRQERVGLDGHVFTLCKFRSMRVDAEKLGPIWASKRDRRITWVGSILRRMRIDELPQLLNVLRGEMSFIGPRPERPYFVEQIAQAVPYYGERAFVKPGLTGWAQVSFPYGASIEDARMKLSYDLYYVKHRSFFLDLLILFSTVRVILLQEGAR